MMRALVSVLLLLSACSPQGQGDRGARVVSVEKDAGAPDSSTVPFDRCAAGWPVSSEYVADPMDGMPCLLDCAPPLIVEPECSPGPGLDRGKADAVVSRIDVSSCTPEGVRRLHGHVSLTFAPSGKVIAVFVEVLKPTKDWDTRECVKNKFASAQVPPFRGVPQTISHSF